MRTWMLAFVAGSALLLGASVAAERPEGPKGYVIAQINVKDPAAYKLYAPKVNPVVVKFGGRYIVRGGATVALEGPAPAGRVVVIEFPSVTAAKAFYDSPEYQEIAPLRHAASDGTSFIVEGFAGL